MSGITLFKHMRNIDAEKMMQKGEILIGNMKSYREIENKEIEDNTEGIKISRKTSETELKVKDESGKFVKYTGDVLTVGPISIHRDILYADCYIYCTSYLYSTEIFRGYYACVKIFDVQGLATQIGQELGKRGLIRRGDGGKVVYIKYKIVDHTNKLPAYWIKDEKFKREEEYRIVFQSHLTNPHDILSPVKVNILEIEKYCERIR